MNTRSIASGVSQPFDITENEPAPHLLKWLDACCTAWHRAEPSKVPLPPLDSLRSLVLYMHRLGSLNHGVLWATDRTIARHTGTSPRTVQRCLMFLEGIGMIERMRGAAAWWTAVGNGMKPTHPYRGGSDNFRRVLVMQGWTPRLAFTAAQAHAILTNARFSHPQPIKKARVTTGRLFLTRPDQLARQANRSPSHEGGRLSVPPFGGVTEDATKSHTDPEPTAEDTEQSRISRAVLSGLATDDEFKAWATATTQRFPGRDTAFLFAQAQRKIEATRRAQREASDVASQLEARTRAVRSMVPAAPE